jgi:hypothetical protein
MKADPMAWLRTFAKAMWTGELSYEDGTSEKRPRGWIWSCYRPHPWAFHKYRLKALYVTEGCGCRRWKWKPRPFAWCGPHFLEVFDER